MDSRNSDNTSSDFLKEIFAHIWALWAVLLFISTMFIAFIFYLPCYLLKEPTASKWHRLVSRIWMYVFLYGTCCSIKVTGKQNYHKNRNYIIVSNHNSFMDILATTPFMPNANKTIAKKELSYIPVFGWIYGLGSILVNRKNEASRKKSYMEMKKVLQFGLDMVIYPEGTRNRTNEPLKTFYDGAFRLSVDTKKPILPAVIFNTRKILPPTKTFYMLPHKIEMHFLPPVEPDRLSAKELKEQVFKMMWDYYEKKR